MKTLDQLIKHCANNDLTMVCYYDDPSDPDYKGTGYKSAKEALEACDVMNLKIVDAEGKRWGWAMIVNEAGAPADEQIADHSCDDHLDAWMSEGETA